MSRALAVFALIIAIILVIIGVQNNAQVHVNFLGWSTGLVPLGVVIVVACVVGFVVAFLLGLQSGVRRRLERRRHTRRIRELEAQVSLLKQQTANPELPGSQQTTRQQRTERP